MLEEIIEYCTCKPHTTVETPFGPDTLVFKVLGKMFALVPIDTGQSINLKNTPEKNIELRETFDAVQPGFHMNKSHWNTVYFNQSVKYSQLKVWVDESYQLVFDSLPSKTKATVC